MICCLTQRGTKINNNNLKKIVVLFIILSLAKVLLPLTGFTHLLLENEKRYDKKAFYQVDRQGKYLSNSLRALLLCFFSFPSCEGLKKCKRAIPLPLLVQSLNLKRKVREHHSVNTRSLRVDERKVYTKRRSIFFQHSSPLYFQNWGNLGNRGCKQSCLVEY